MEARELSWEREMRGRRPPSSIADASAVYCEKKGMDFFFLLLFQSSFLNWIGLLLLLIALNV